MRQTCVFIAATTAGYRLLFLVALLSVGGTAFAATPVVSNVRVSQRSGTGLVDIYYDVADADGNKLAITVQVSNNGGVSYNAPASHLSGDLGQNISPANNRHIIWDAGADWDALYFPNVRVKVIADDGYDAAPTQMCYIPAGSFQMGDPYAEGYGEERPVHSLYVSGFYMDKFEVTQQLWDEVYSWAVGHGYTFNSGGSVATNHPIQSVNWYDVVKWCNARSEMRARTPVYYASTNQTADNVYRSGQVDLTAAMVNWSANGYRLPTEAEWEKAARGGLGGHHYPWPSAGGAYSAHINGSKANYSGSGDPFGGGSPQTTPAGYYNGSQTPAGVDMANGYGLYDMAGNVWEWCWDSWDGTWYSNPGASASDTRGPVSGSYRLQRGGAWNDGVTTLRCAQRNYRWPLSGASTAGFRCVRGL